MTTPMPTGEIVELIRGQARLEAKIDHFLQGQTQMRTEIDVIKSDVAAIKNVNTSYKAYFHGGLAIFSIFWTGFTLFGLPILHRKLGLG